MANDVWGGGVDGNIKLNKVMVDIASSVMVLHRELGLCHEDISNYSGVGRTIRRAQGEEGGQYKSMLQVNINLEPLFINCMKAVRLSFNMVCIKGIFILPTTKSEWFKLTSSVKFFDVSQKWQKECKKYVSKCH